METVHRVCLPVFISLLITVQAVASEWPEQDIVEVVSTTALSESDAVPGLLTGQRITDELRPLRSTGRARPAGRVAAFGRLRLAGQRARTAQPRRALRAAGGRPRVS